MVAGCAGWLVVVVPARVGPSGAVGRGSQPDDCEGRPSQHHERSDARDEATPAVRPGARLPPSAGMIRAHVERSPYHGCGVMTGGRWYTAKKSLVLEYKKRFEI